MRGREGAGERGFSAQSSQHRTGHRAGSLHTGINGQSRLDIYFTTHYLDKIQNKTTNIYHNISIRIEHVTDQTGTFHNQLEKLEAAKAA